MSDHLSIWTDHYTVNWYDADPGNKATLTALCNYLQESAWRHANHLGFGYRTATKINQAWVIIRLLLKMDRYPSWQETITVRTWPRGVDGLFAIRDFEILDAEGNRLGGASSQWFIIDVETRKPQTTLLVQDILPLATHVPALDEQPEKIIIPEPLSFTHAIKAEYSDIDMYGHVNNTRYVEWTLNTFPEEIHKENLIRSFLIEFLAETHLGEEIEIFRNKDGADPSYVKGVRLDDDKTLFRTRIRWEKK
jgi:medium-chain acyl-[acyl-carrier-protein] hydrolase